MDVMSRMQMWDSETAKNHAMNTVGIQIIQENIFCHMNTLGMNNQVLMKPNANSTK